MPRPHAASAHADPDTSVPNPALSRSRATPSPSDAELLEAIRAGDESAFTVLYERYFDRVYHFAYARMRNRADAEEVTQETFLAVFRSVEAFAGRSALLSWIYGIAKNNVNNHLRRSKARENRIERAEEELVRNAHTFDACTPEEHVHFQRCAQAVEESLGSISSWQAEVFALRHFENLPIQDIAKRMSRSNDAVRSSLYRVKRLIVEAVDADRAGPN
ncbi:MAG: RNA polymerase sigma factor [Myxococcota bacterium]